MSLFYPFFFTHYFRIVSTDRLARGMDLCGVQCVISYSPTKYLKTYIHRAGRTARAGALGLTVTLMQKSEHNKFLALLQQAGKTDISEVCFRLE